MKILFISDNFPPEVNAPATRTFEHCREWVKLGHDVTIITGFPNFPQGKIYPGYRNRLVQQENMGGIRVIRVWTYITANEGFLRRILDYVSFALSASIAGLRINTDVIIATSPQFFSAVGGWFVHRIGRKPWVMEVRDLWPDSIRAVGAMHDGVILRFFTSLEYHLYRSAKLIISVTNSFKSEIVKKGIKPGKIRVIKNGANLQQFSPRPKNTALLAQLGIQDKFIIGYLGTHGLAHKLDFILECIPDFDPQKYHFLFVGDGAAKFRLVNQVAQMKLPHVTLLPSVPKAEMADYLSIVDCVLVPLKKSELFKTVIPSKIFEAAAMQKPILLGVDGESRQMVEAAGIGLYFEPENRLEFKRMVEAMAGDQERYSEIAENGLIFARQYERKHLAQGMIKWIESEMGA